MSVTQESDPTVRPAQGPGAQAEPAVGTRPGLLGTPLVRHLLLAVLAGAVVFGLSEVIEPYRQFQLATVGAYLCAAAGLTMLTGLSGQLSLGHGALMAVGAYSAVLTANALSERAVLAGYSLPVALAASVVVTTVLGLLIGVAATRLRGPYLAGVTLAVAVVVPSVTTTFDDLLGGDQGLYMAVDPVPDAIAGKVPFGQWQVFVCWAGALLTMVVLANIARGRFGRTMRAVRDDEAGARLSGIDVARTQTVAFAVSAGAAGLGGGLYAFLIQSASPGAFAMTLSLFLLMAVVIGGIGRLAGAVWGALLLVALPELSSTVGHAFDVSAQTAQRLDGNLSLAVFGLTLVVVMLLAPSGITGLTDRVRRRFAVARRRRGA